MVTTFHFTHDGQMMSREINWPDTSTLPPVSVSLAPSTDRRIAARLLRCLADELEALPRDA
jgi:hypothetical protein